MKAKKNHTNKSEVNVGISAMNNTVPNDVWQLIYWPAKDDKGNVTAGAGRAEYLRVIFEQANIPYVEVSKDISDFFWRHPEMQSFPVLAPPAIQIGEFLLSQTAVCAKFLATQFNLYPNNPIDGARAEAIVTTVHEYIAEGRRAFHPVRNTMSYRLQKDAAQPHIEYFKSKRLPRYFKYFERVLNANQHSLTFFIGNDLSYADLQVMVMLQVTDQQWPDAYTAQPTPLLKAFRKRIESFPNIKKYLESPRRKPFCGDSLM